MLPLWLARSRSRNGRQRLAMPFVKGQSGNPLGRASEALFTNAIRKAALTVDKAAKRRKLELIAEKLVAKAIEGDNWCIGQIGDRLDGKPTEHKEQGGHVDHAVRIVWAGMPAFPATPSTPPTAPMIVASSITELRTCRRPAPIARSSASSRTRWAMIIENVL